MRVGKYWGDTGGLCGWAFLIIYELNFDGIVQGWWEGYGASEFLFNLLGFWPVPFKILITLSFLLFIPIWDSNITNLMYFLSGESSLILCW